MCLEDTFVVFSPKGTYKACWNCDGPDHNCKDVTTELEYRFWWGDEWDKEWWWIPSCSGCRHDILPEIWICEEDMYIHWKCDSCNVSQMYKGHVQDKTRAPISKDVERILNYQDIAILTDILMKASLRIGFAAGTWIRSRELPSAAGPQGRWGCDKKKAIKNNKKQ